MHNKKIIRLLAIALPLVALAGCGGGSGATVTDGGKVLNIHAWNDEFQNRFRDYYPDYVSTNAAGDEDTLKDGTKVKWTIVANQDNAYQNALDASLENRATTPVDQQVDMFLMEADYALKYVETDYTLDIVKDLGIKTTDLADQYQYTKDIVTDSKGAIKGSSWQATPGLFAYRRDVAEEVLGSDDPAVVQTQLDTWAKFDAVAGQMHDDGYFMLSGFDDAYRTFSNNMSNPWVDSNKKIVIDDSILAWIEQTKDYTDNGYNNKTSLWSSEWAADQGPEGKAFGFFYSTWGINFTLLGNSLADPDGAKEVGNGDFGNWAVVEGPASYYWGGTWIAGVNGTDNGSHIKDIMLKLTMDKAIMKDITLDTEDFTNTISGMTEIANDETYGSAFLGGQNHVKLFVESAKNIDMSNISAYDQGLNESIQSSFRDYFLGTVDEDTAWDNFYDTIADKYPALTL